MSENYLVNPVNPMVTIRHPAFTEKSWRRKSNGRFGSMKTRPNPKRKASHKRKMRRNPVSPLMLLNKRRVIRTHKRKASKSRRIIHRTGRALMVINPKRRSMRRSFRRNPLIPAQLGDVTQLIMKGALIVAGSAGGGYVVGKLSEQFPVMQKPLVRIAAFVGGGTVAYLLLKKVKQLPQGMAASLAVGFMIPAIMEAKDMLLAKMGGAVPVPVSYGPEMGAYVPAQNLGAYVPAQLGESSGY